MNLDEKIQNGLDRLRREIKGNAHLTDKLYVMSTYHEVRKYKSYLSEEDQDYLKVVDHIIQNNLEWKNP